MKKNYAWRRPQKKVRLLNMRKSANLYMIALLNMSARWVWLWAFSMWALADAVSFLLSMLLSMSGSGSGSENMSASMSLSVMFSALFVMQALLLYVKDSKRVHFISEVWFRDKMAGLKLTRHIAGLCIYLSASYQGYTYPILIKHFSGTPKLAENPHKTRFHMHLYLNIVSYSCMTLSGSGKGLSNFIN